MIRTFLAASLLAVALPSLAPAQGLGDMAVIIAPHSTSYAIGSGATKRTIAQTAIPIATSMTTTVR